MEKFVLFTTGGGSADPLNWTSDEAALYSISEFKSMKPASSRSIDIFFETSSGEEIVTLGVKNMTHIAVMRSITQALNSQQAVVAIADVDNSIFCNPHIYSASINTSTPILYKNKIVNATTVEVVDVNTKLKKLNSMTLANVHSGAATVQVYLLEQATSALYYIIKDVVIPVGSTLKLESDELDYDAGLFNLYVKLGGSTPVDVIVR
mgnify:CR=1 FL=1